MPYRKMNCLLLNANTFLIGDFIDINEYPADSRCSKFHYLFIISPRDFPLIAINSRPQLAAVMAWRP